jgi:hypothetical protein
MLRELALVTVLTTGGMSAACDPGWSYHVPDSKSLASGPQADQGVSIWARGELFTGSLTVDVYLTNRDADLLVLSGVRFQVLDTSHRALPRYGDRPSSEPGMSPDQAAVTLGPGQGYTMRGMFRVHPNSSLFGSRNTELKTLTVVVDGLTKRGEPISRSILLEWD